MDLDDWDLSALNLEAYLGRIGVTAQPPGLEALDTLLTAHARTFAFDNIDVLLGTHPGVDLEAVQHRLVERGRGGYSFDHAILVGAALSALGYPVVRRLARVGEPWTTGRTHLDLVVTLPDGSTWLADPGVGFPPLGALPLQDRAIRTTGGWAYLLREVSEPEYAWLLERERAQHDGWEALHWTDLSVVRPVDISIAHHYASTSATSPFTRTLTVARHGLGQFTSITVDETGCLLTRRRPGEPSMRWHVGVTEALRALLPLAGGLTEDEVDALREVMEGLVGSVPVGAGRS